MSDGVVYLLHFSGPVAPGRHTCQHHLGYADDLGPHQRPRHRPGRTVDAGRPATWAVLCRRQDLGRRPQPGTAAQAAP